MRTNQIALWDTYNSDFLPLPRKPQYPNPFVDVSSALMPTSMNEALRWGEFIVSLNGPYREALKRIIAYCITDPEVVESDDEIVVVDKETRSKYRTVFGPDCLSIRTNTSDIDLDLLTYGNSFVSVQTKFNRFLSCTGEHNGKRCTFQAPLREVIDKEPYQFNFSNFEFVATCPVCGSRGVWQVKDHYSKDMHDLYLKRWNVHELELLHDPFTDQETVIWRIPEDYKALVQQGLPHVLTTAPLEVLEAMRDGYNITIDPEVILHLKESTLSGIKSRGWGIPRIVANFQQALLYQILQRHNETIALESLAPLRVLSPPPSGGAEGKDPIMNGSMNLFTDHMKNMIQQRRRDPSSWFVSPYPLTYQAFGGDATQFLPKEMLADCLDTLLTSVGIPVDMYKGSLQVNAAPIALRLFESFWSNLIDNNNKLLSFIIKRINALLGWEPVTARFMRITHADDMNRQQQKLQLASMGAISQTTALESIGLNKHEELRRMMEEQRDEAEQQQKQQETLETTKQLSDAFGGGALNAMMNMQQQQQGAMGGDMGGSMPPMGGGGAPPMPQGGGNSSLLPGQDPISQMIAQNGYVAGDTPEDLMAKAQTLAQQFLSMGNTASALRKLKQTDPQLHAIVKSCIEQIRSNARSEGQQQVMQQQFGGGGGGM